MIKKLLTASFITAFGTWASAANAAVVPEAPTTTATTQCYVWSHLIAPTINSPYSPSTSYSFTTKGDPSKNNTVTRTADGVYKVSCKGLGHGSSTAGGNVQVTAFGGNPGYCKVKSWSSIGTDFNAVVNCYGADNSLVNSQFTLLYAL